MEGVASERKVDFVLRSAQLLSVRATEHMIGLQMIWPVTVNQANGKSGMLWKGWSSLGQEIYARAIWLDDKAPG